MGVFHPSNDKFENNKFSANKIAPKNPANLESPAYPEFPQVPAQQKQNPLFPKDKISVLLENSETRIMYFYSNGKRIKSSVEFTSQSGSHLVLDVDTLYAYGWHLFFSPDGEFAILTNGNESHIVQSAARKMQNASSVM